MNKNKLLGFFTLAMVFGISSCTNDKATNQNNGTTTTTTTTVRYVDLATLRKDVPVITGMVTQENGQDVATYTVGEAAVKIAETEENLNTNSRNLITAKTAYDADNNNTETKKTYDDAVDNFIDAYETWKNALTALEDFVDEDRSEHDLIKGKDNADALKKYYDAVKANANNQ